MKDLFYLDAVNEALTEEMARDDKVFIIEANKEQSFEFKLPYKIALSEMDKIGSSNFLTKTLVNIAKYVSNVKSEFRIEATAKVSGNAISPLTKKEIKVVY